MVGTRAKTDVFAQRGETLVTGMSSKPLRRILNFRGGGYIALKWKAQISDRPNCVRDNKLGRSNWVRRMACTGSASCQG